jgi:Zn-dependent protease with chaperone function/tetratricopeptide (TPR) repeat protein
MLRRFLHAGLVLVLVGQPLAAQTVSNSELFGKSLKAAQEALRQFGAYDALVEAKRVNDIGYRVVGASGFTKFPITFHLIDMLEPNAFALPGGQIFVTRGMLEMGLSDDMLACLLGHEIAHVVLEHGIKLERRATLLNILSQAALVGVLIGAEQRRRDPVNTVPDPYGVSQDNGSGNLVQGTAAAGLVISELLLRSYSREFEDQADEEGQRWAAGAGFQPRGTQDLFAMTHPFFDSRLDAAIARGRDLKPQPPQSADALREKTQQALLAWLAAIPPEEMRPPMPNPNEPPEPRSDERVRLRSGSGDYDREPLIKREALAAWPQGPTAEDLRLERLHRLRAEETERTPLARDYGKLLAAYEREIAQVRELTPESPALRTFDADEKALREDSKTLYPQAQQVLASGVYETSFLETFLSNWPEAAEGPKVALLLGDAYSRSGRPADAVTRYLQAGEAKGTDQAARALAGLRNLTPYLDDLAALQQLAEQKEDVELSRLAEDRLSAKVGTFTDLSVGAAYLRRYPTGPHAAKIEGRVNDLAQNLYGEMVLYQAVGDSIKALDRIQKILTYAPTSPAADRLRERTVVQG